jgi:signal transduction histidine kinase
MDGGGSLTIRTGVDNGYCVVSIADTGVGIPSDIMPHIFDPFYTTKGVGEGTGLGLSVSKGIVEQHGGIIEVDSRVGAGTTFIIKLPLK